ncbi:uncharacterized protein LACBIDRAFT_335650 [Laccaria bicolor S238N-H82]|uniref:Predicted protein n=1 Tax=Laccaria bicolor (strain S238N-H82 / ATCC MYA-4686) TaxID=486041 RepID=B0E2Y7_LACBS|nr:uncharacterized protein LACBIDRAFT_335650 [Laccaria bicolor S238N-H82]EDQ98796.1 predicted protein [Laccaria bicolor S238N-H82]|eukprot:XP_001890555.1 predicted protein [Laccaria bicolor S238N-H82]
MTLIDFYDSLSNLQPSIVSEFLIKMPCLGSSFHYRDTSVFDVYMGIAIHVFLNGLMELFSLRWVFTLEPLSALFHDSAIRDLALQDFFGMAAGPVTRQALGLLVRKVGGLALLKERGGNGLELLLWDCEIKGEIVGLQRVNDTLFLSNELDGILALAEALHFDFGSLMTMAFFPSHV